MGNAQSASELAEQCESAQGPGALLGQVVIITGASSGIGNGILQALAPLGPTIFVAGRDKQKCRQVIEEARELSDNADIHFLNVDFANFESIKSAVERFKKKNLPIHLLFNNAGAIFSKYTQTVDGFEATMRKFR
jgi:NAD(P)-dependent dehydrogenase (short-subunit alcohol dehydrogenase family)